MHPSRQFAWDDRAAILAFVAARAFAHIVAATPDGLRAAHAPVLVTEAGTLRFHLARHNTLTVHLDGARAIASISSDDAYVSPDWYGSADQVPTWLYIAVEAEGPVRRLSDDELVAQVDGLSAFHEAALAPKPMWTRDKMDPAKYAALIRGIVGFELSPETLRGTRKLGQNKRGSDVDGLIAGLRDTGRDKLAALVAEARA